MIERKKKICKGCNKPQYIWARGFCKQCDPGKSKSNEQVAEDKATSVDRNVFFANMTINMPTRCENCGDSLQATNAHLKRCVTAHILPKAKFDSVDTHPANVMYLGVFCGCHDKYDHGNAESRKRMKCYDLAIERAATFYELLTPGEQVHADKYLGL